MSSSRGIGCILAMAALAKLVAASGIPAEQNGRDVQRRRLERDSERCRQEMMDAEVREEACALQLQIGG